MSPAIERLVHVRQHDAGEPAAGRATHKNTGLDRSGANAKETLKKTDFAKLTGTQTELLDELAEMVREWDVNASLDNQLFDVPAWLRRRVL